ncbi:MAG: alkaline phosphatase family protein [Bacillota bacterium]
MSERRAGRSWRWLVLLVVPLLLLLVSAGAALVALSLQGDLDTYTPVDTGPLAAGEKSARLAQRVVVVVVDGLRVDVSRQMPFLESLRGRGAWTSLTTGQPSFSKPSYAVLSTGTWQEYHGVAMNSHPGAVKVDTIFSVARNAGLRTALYGYTYWGEINPSVDHSLVGDYPDHELYARARASLEAREADLTYVHLSAVDEAGHESGGALSEEYLEAAREVDGMIAGLASCLDLAKDVLVVTADHGQLDRNNRGGSGHGGWEREVTTVPLVMVGAGVKPGEIPAGRQVDVVPTVATLLGLPVPAHSLGNVLWAGLDVPEDVRADKQVKRAAQFVDFARAYVTAVSAPSGEASGSQQAAALASDPLAGATASLEEARSRLAESAYEQAFTLAGDSMEKAERAMGAARSRMVWAHRWPRLPFLLVPLVVLGLLAWKARRSLLEVLAWGAGYLVLYHVFYAWVFGDVYSLSVFPDGSLPTMFRLFGFPAYLALAIILTAVLWRGTATARAAEGITGRQHVVWLVEKAILAPYVVLGIVAAVGLFGIGSSLGFYLPSFRLNFLYFCALLQLLWLGPIAVVAPLAAWLATRQRYRATDMADQAAVR